MKRHKILSLAIIVLLSAICYQNSLDCGLVFDDTAAIVNNQDVIGPTNLSNIFTNDFWGSPMILEESHGSYRPLTILSFRLNYLIDQLNPKHYHGVNVLLHCVVVILVQHLANSVLPLVSATICTFIFAIHPIHVEAVTGVVGRAELLSCIFLLLAFRVYKSSRQCHRVRLLGHWLMFVILIVLGTLCKEQCITVLGICFAYEVYLFLFERPTKSSKISSILLRLAFLVAVCLCFMYLRMRIMGMKLPVFSKFSNPASYANSVTRRLTYAYLIAFNMYLLCWPMDLCCDWSMGSIPLVESLGDVRNLATLAVFICLAVATLALFHRGLSSLDREAWFLSLAFLTIPFVPSTNLFFPVGFVVAERVLYVPSLGICLALGLAHRLLCGQVNGGGPRLGSTKRCFEVALLVMSLIFGIRTYARNFDWRTEYSLFSSGIRVNPGNAKLWNNVGHSIENDEPHLVELALTYFQRAADIQPDDVGAHMNVARCLQALNRTNEAEESYRLAMLHVPKPVKGITYHTRVDPKVLSLYADFAGLLMENASRQDEAESMLHKAISLRAGNHKAHQMLGNLFLKQKRFSEALAQFQTVLQLRPLSADSHYNYGAILLEHGDATAGVQHLHRALVLDANHQHAMWALSTHFSDSADFSIKEKALEFLLRLKKSKYSPSKVLFSLGMLLTDLSRFEDSAAAYVELLALEPNHLSALFNLALLSTNELARPLEAVPLLRRILAIQPQHFKSCILLGDLEMSQLHNLAEADRLFQRGLELRPGDFQVQHNICVLRAEQGRLEEAKECLAQLLITHPGDTQLQQNYAVVKRRLQSASSKP